MEKENFIKITASERYKSLCECNNKRDFIPFMIRYRDLDTCTAWKYRIDTVEELNEFLSGFPYGESRILGFCGVEDEDDTRDSE